MGGGSAESLTRGIGAATCPHDADSREALIKATLYLATAQGRHRAAVASAGEP
jgi:hypothetical protein